MKNFILSLIVLLLMFSTAFPQKVGDRWKLRIELNDVTEIDGGKKFKLGINSIIKIYWEKNGIFFFKVIKADGNCTSIEGDSYKVATSKLHPGNAQFISSFDLNLITIPIKYRFPHGSTSSHIATDVNLGLSIAYQFKRISVFINPLCIGPITTSNLNSDVPNTKLGVTVSVGFIVSFFSGRQIIFSIGIDHIPGNYGKIWPYQNKLWFGFGSGLNLHTF